MIKPADCLPLERRPARRGSEGFSLIEVMIAMVILGIMLMTLISVFVYGYNVIARAKQLAAATQICQSEIERIRGLSFDALSGLSSTFTDPKMSSLINGQGVRVVEAGAGSDILKLTVSVAWTYRGRPLRKDVVTFITRMGVNKK